MRMKDFLIFSKRVKLAEKIKERPEIAKELNKCMTIALDALKHGRIWTTGNPLKTLVSRKDISIFEEFTMYEILCDLLGLGRDDG